LFADAPLRSSALPPARRHDPHLAGVTIGCRRVCAAAPKPQSAADDAHSGTGCSATGGAVMPPERRGPRIETLAGHAGSGVDEATGAVTPPIHLSTTFDRAPSGDYPHGHVYTRTSNPNRQALETSLSALEGGAATAAFSSGSAATMSLFQALAPGDHVLAPDDAYHGTSRLLREVLGSWGLAVTFVDMTDLAQVRAALQPETQLVWVETPSNPLLKVTDIGAVTALAH